MSNIIKIFFVLLIVALVTSLSFSFFAFQERDREYKKRILLEDKIASVLKEKRKLEKDMELAVKDRDEAVSKVDALNLRIRQEEAGNRTIKMDIANKDAQITRLQQSLETFNREKLEASRKISELQNNYQKIVQDYAKLKNENSMLQNKINDLSQKSVDLDKIILKKPEEEVFSEEGAAPAETEDTAVPDREPLKGSVVVVNKEYGFVVTDLGSKSGIEQGMLVQIMDSGILLGEAEVDKIYETMSSANLLEGADINKIKRGNLVIESR